MQNNLYQLRNKDRLALGIILTSIFAAFIFTVAEARGQVEIHQSQSSSTSVNGQSSSNSVTTSTLNGQEKTIIHTPNGALVVVGSKIKYCLGNNDSICGPTYSLHADGTIRP